MSVRTRLQGLISRALPQALVDDREDDKPVRMTRYGELWIPAADSSLLGYYEEGSVITALNGTVGTGLTGVTAQIVYNATGPDLYIANNEAAAGGKSLYVLYLKMIATAAATSATSFHYAVNVDPAPRAITTDNFANLTVINPNTEKSAPIATPTVKFQNNATVSVIAAAGSGAKTIGRGTLGGLNVVGDEFYIVFGRGDIQAHAGLTAAQAAALSKRVSHTNALVIPPQGVGTVHRWALAQAAAMSPEVEIVMVAR